MAASHEVFELSRLLDSHFAAEEITLDDRVSRQRSRVSSLQETNETTTDSSQNLVVSDVDISNDHASSIAKGYDVSIHQVAHEKDVNSRRFHRTPWALRRLHLICLIIVLVLMIVALEVAQYISKKNQGLATTTQRIHYVWTYGPTAGFSILAIFWGALEYQTKVIMPWKLMTDSPSKAKNSLLLDYVSPNSILVLWRSMQARHWSVVVTVLGSQLVLLATVISTGLFMLEPTLVQQKEAPMAVRKFDDTNLNITVINALPVLVVEGVMSESIWKGYPPHTDDLIAIEPFAAVHELPESEVSKTANVNVFSADLDCHIGYVANATMRATISEWSLKASLSDSECTTDLIDIGTRADDSSDHVVDPAQQRVGAATIQKCPQSGDTDVGYLVLAFTQVTLPKNLEFGNKGDAIMLPMDSFELNSTVLFCQPTGKLQKALVTTDPYDSIGEVIYANTSAHLGISSWDMALAFNDSVLDAAKTIPTTADMYAYDTYFRILQEISLQDPVKYMDSRVLEAESRRLFTAVWAQIANQYLLTSSSQQIAGIYRVNLLRLLIREATFSVLEAIMATILVCAILLLFIRPLADLADMPSLGRVAAILSRSKEIMGTLKHTGSRPIRDLERLLSDQRCHLALQLDGGVIVISDLRPHPAPSLPDSTTAWWRPIALSAWMRILLLVLPLVTIITLEVTFHLSEKQNGLGDVTTSGYEHYTWTVTPAVILTSIKLLGQSLAFSIGALDPYLVLKAGASSAKQTLFHDFLAQTSLFRCFSSTRLSRWAVLSVSVSTLFSPFLNIVVSGLFDEQPVPRYRALDTHAVEQLTKFEARTFRRDAEPPKYLDCSFDVWKQDTLNSANLLLQQAISFPDGTFENYMFPQMADLWAIPDSFHVSSGSVITPGYQPRTVCQAMEPSSFQYTLRNDGFNIGGKEWRMPDPSSFYLNFTHPDLTGCDRSSPQYRTEYESCTPGLLSLGFTINPNNTLFSKTLDVGLDLAAAGFMDPNAWTTSSSLAHSSHQCPNLTLVYGDWNQRSNTSLNLGGVACYYNMEEAQLNISYALPQLEVTGVSPTKTSPVHGDPSCWPFMSQSINNYLANGPSEPYDSLFMAALNGSDKQTFFKPSNAATFANRVSQIYDTFLTQYFSSNMRNTNFTDGVPQVPMILVDDSRQRLFQSRISTSILEGLLGIIWVCTVIALVLFDSKELLPKDPCSIAAQASLFADSKFLDLIPAGAEHLSDEELAETIPFKDHLFSMGWWEKEGGEQRIFGIDIGQAVSVGQSDPRRTWFKRFLGM